MTDDNKENCDCIKECICDRTCPTCGGAKKTVSACNSTFWDALVMKLLRNFASMKFQWMLLLYIPIVWGMFNPNPETNMPWISATLGLSFLSGGFITLATSRIIARTKLTENTEFDTDR